MALLSLDDPLLRRIASFLYSRDVLNLSLTSKRVFRLTNHRILSVIRCEEPDQLLRLHEFLLQPTHSPFPKTSDGGSKRPQSLQDLTVYHTTFMDLELKKWFISRDNFTQVCLLGDILLQTHNLRHLSLDRLHPCIINDPRIRDALSALHRLEDLRVSTLGDFALEVIQAIPSTLQRLTLSYHNTHDYHRLDGEPKSLRPLLQTLSTFELLHAVTLINFTPHYHLAYPWDPRYVPPQLPSIRRLTILSSSVEALDIVELCPNLIVFEFSLDKDASCKSSAGPRWCSLHKLVLAQPHEALCLVDRLGTVEDIHVLNELDVRIDVCEDGSSEHHDHASSSTTPSSPSKCLQSDKEDTCKAMDAHDGVEAGHDSQQQTAGSFPLIEAKPSRSTGDEEEFLETDGDTTALSPGSVTCLPSLDHLSLYSGLVGDGDGGSDGSVTLVGNGHVREEGIRALLELLSTTSPGTLRLSVATESGSLGADGLAAALVAEIAHVAPRLRSLHVQLNIHNPLPTESTQYGALVWHSDYHPPLDVPLTLSLCGQDGLPAALASLRLECLLISVPAPTRAHFLFEPELYADSEEGQAMRADARVQELQRITMLEALPAMLAIAIPTLRVLAIGDVAPSRAVLGFPLSADEEQDEDVLALSEVRARNTSNTRWWSVVVGSVAGAVPGVVEIEAWEGERVRASVEHGVLPM